MEAGYSLSRNTAAGGCGTSLACSCLVLLPRERGILAFLARAGAPWRPNPFKPPRERHFRRRVSLLVSPNNCIDPSKQLLRGFCFRPSAPSHA